LLFLINLPEIPKQNQRLPTFACVKDSVLVSAEILGQLKELNFKL